MDKKYLINPKRIAKNALVTSAVSRSMLLYTFSYDTPLDNANGYVGNGAMPASPTAVMSFLSWMRTNMAVLMMYFRGPIGTSSPENAGACTWEHDQQWTILGMSAFTHVDKLAAN